MKSKISPKFQTQAGSIVDLYTLAKVPHYMARSFKSVSGCVFESCLRRESGSPGVRPLSSVFRKKLNNYSGSVRDEGSNCVKRPYRRLCEVAFSVATLVEHYITDMCVKRPQPSYCID